ncbi:hypothetical protein CAL7716_090750 [Calothrix sp. PCC 7716]|nr:hypothetical protein CAL7716_090750 [Calothrix sp. PCC 7716]
MSLWIFDIVSLFIIQLLKIFTKKMQITLTIPDNIVYQLADNPEQLSRRAFESLVVDAYRSRQLSTAEVQRILNLPGRLATDAFLKAHEAYLPYTETDLDQDLQSIDQALAQL